MVAATLLAISPVFLGRTPAGFSDTDVYNIFFPLMISWLFLESFILRHKEKTKKYIYAGIAGLFTGIFAFTWDAWWYIFDFIVGTMIIYLLYLAIKYKKKVLTNLKNKGFEELEYSWVLEDNIASIKLAEHYGGKVNKTYALYEKKIE